MAKKHHWQQTVVKTLSAIQLKFRNALSLIPTTPRPMLTAIEAHGHDAERFQTPNQALLPWKDKQTQQWEVLGLLETENGRKFGFQLSFTERNTQHDFVGPLPMRWITDTLSSSYFIFSDFQQAERKKTCIQNECGGFGLLFSKPLQSNRNFFSAKDTLHLSLGPHSMRLISENQVRIDVQIDRVSLHLELELQLSRVSHGNSGYIEHRESPQHHVPAFLTSYYQLKTSGVVVLEQQRLNVKGVCALNHEKSALPLVSRQGLSPQSPFLSQFCLALGSGCDLFIEFSKDSSWGSLQRGSEAKHLVAEDLRIEIAEYYKSPKTKLRYPVKFSISSETLGFKINARPVLNDQEVDLSLTTLESFYSGLLHVEGDFEKQSFAQLAWYKSWAFDSRARSQTLRFLFT